MAEMEITAAVKSTAILSLTAVSQLSSRYCIKNILQPSTLYEFSAAVSFYTER